VELGQATQAGRPDRCSCTCRNGRRRSRQDPRKHGRARLAKCRRGNVDASVHTVRLREGAATEEVHEKGKHTLGTAEWKWTPPSPSTPGCSPAQDTCDHVSWQPDCCTDKHATRAWRIDSVVPVGSPRRGREATCSNEGLSTRIRSTAILFNAVLSRTTTASAFCVSLFIVRIELYGWTTTSLAPSWFGNTEYVYNVTKNPRKKNKETARFGLS
jgi:hypothetical protein